MKPARMGTMLCLGLAGLTGGCGVFAGPKPMAGPVMVPFDAPAAQACPWVEGERGRPALPVQGTGLAPPAGFVPGCAIVRFTVAADGSVSSGSLRAAYPLDDGPSALAVLRQMRFQPGRPDAVYMIRLSMRRGADGRMMVTPESRARLGFWVWS